MRNLVFYILLLSLSACKDDYKRSADVSTVFIEPIVKDSLLSVRAIDYDKEYIYYGSSDHFGKRGLNKQFKINITELELDNSKAHYKNVLTYNDKPLHFRAIKAINGNLFAISIANPTRLYKLHLKSNKPKLVYEEINEKAFYDSIDFWNDKEGIAIGDPTDDCISIIITRDGGESWTKLLCKDLPKAKEGEAAFAASDTNICIVGDHTWVATGGKTSRVLYSPDKGNTWEVYSTPIIQGKETTGMYSIDFYDEDNGFAIGGDYTKSNDTLANKIRTKDGGKTWEIVANGKGPGYRSCVQYIPNRGGEELVAIGFKGIDYSNDSGNSWKHLSDEGFYTIRFLNDSIAYAAGRGQISKLIFR
ncbi:WD40/YVTN/BNR-like repeat-containing protein [Winogradskyella sp. PG-2]|uniref:WD40/YVTN/BNR-like repeat-containing protein n=1 Tax=Winogradskyella sp. PG-2 TaxID=754409 RepID=UPI0004587971|nr:oxidoreductase [Winogradskyella sp. PG-2]BAO76808.1 probable oxidoreductase [Winogradskyella sp. PG-2]